MSYVNQVSKNNTTYDIQDSRTFVLDLGDVTSLYDGERFTKAISGADLEALVNAENGIVKFVMDGTGATCNVVSKGGSAGSGYQAMATLFMQMQSDAYTTFVVVCMGNSQSASATGYLYSQEISGGSGAGIEVIEKNLGEWEAEDDTYLAEFTATESDYNKAVNNDFVAFKGNDYDGDQSYFMTKCYTGTGDGDQVMFSTLADSRIYIAMIMRVDDGAGGYEYVGMAGKIPQQEPCTKLYRHQVAIDMGGGQGATFIFENISNNEVDDLSSFISALNNDVVLNIKMIINSQCYSIVGINYDSNNQPEKLVQMNTTSLAEISLSSFSGGTFTDSVNIINN